MKEIALPVFVALNLASCAPSDHAAQVQNREAVRAVFSEIWSKGNVDLISELFSEDFVGHFPGETIRGHDGLADAVIAHRRAFPDWIEKVEDEIVDGDRVVIRFISKGTNMGEFLGNPPTGNTIEISEVAIFKITDGRITEQWVYPDILSLQRQLVEKRHQ